MSDTHNLASALDIIRDAHPDAATVLFGTSDQRHHGFWLAWVRRADKTDVAVSELTHSQVQDYVGDLPWDGPLREDEYGYAEVDLATAPSNRRT